MKCTAGGSLSNKVRAEKDFTYFLNGKNGEIELDSDYTWVKCNNDFKSFYLTNYADGDFETFSQMLETNPEVKLNWPLVFKLIKKCLKTSPICI